MTTEQKAQLMSELRRDEGEILHAYQDSEGFWTIGVGRLIDERRGGGITKEESGILLVHDIDAVQADLDRALPWWRELTANRQRVLANMRFNLGLGSAKLGKGLLGFRNTLEAMRLGDFEAAAKGMEASKWAKQVGARADRLVTTMRRG